MNIKRIMAERIKAMAEKYPIVTLTGVRQCGKTTLLKTVFPDYKYISLEDTDIREIASEDPRGFLKKYNEKIILDEVQRVPQIFPYLQTHTDEAGIVGQYILSGSHNFSLMESITQSLAGRTAVLKLAPFSISELKESGMLIQDVDRLMLKGFYPRTYSFDIDSGDFFPSYLDTYIERDVRLIRNIPDAYAFRRFLKLCASRAGSILNIADLSRDCDISSVTARNWLSVLEKSYIIFFLQSYNKNYSKRIVKSPKLYFADTGLLCHLLNIETEDQLKDHSARGSIFENMIVADYLKYRYFQGKTSNAFFWRDTNGNEIDIVTENSDFINAYEIKSSKTMNSKYFSPMIKIMEEAALTPERMHCIYCGDISIKTKNGEFIRYDEAFT